MTERSQRFATDLKRLFSKHGWSLMHDGKSAELIHLDGEPLGEDEVSFMFGALYATMDRLIEFKPPETEVVEPMSEDEASGFARGLISVVAEARPPSSHQSHRWSGWPGAWCLDCGIADPAELCISQPGCVCVGDEFEEAEEAKAERPKCKLATMPPCEAPGAGLFDPYKKALEK